MKAKLFVSAENWTNNMAGRSIDAAADAGEEKILKCNFVNLLIIEREIQQTIKRERHAR
jgi:hypothetical protein